MQEAFIHLVWQLGYFDKASWCTADGNAIEVYHPGRLNTDAGPDFKGARLKIGDLYWHGDVELHLITSGWQQHKHQHDPAYNSVVLHVVLEDDGITAIRQDGSPVPTATLQNRIRPDVYLRYDQLQASLHTIPCEPQIAGVSSMAKISMLDRMLMQRLQRKAAGVAALFKHNNHDWEETAWQWLCRGFGFKINATGFESLSRQLPLKVLLRHANSALQVEALLFGVSGLLQHAPSQPWTDQLQREWKLLQHKWNLQDKVINTSQWLFSRMRPANFPTLRIAQLAKLLQRQPKLFSFLMHASPDELFTELRVTPSSYWQTHYHFGRESKEDYHTLGTGSAQNLLINVVAPLRVAYGQATDQPQYIEDAVSLLQSQPGEDNKIIRYWKKLDMPTTTAADSQGLIELFNEYCTPKRCLQCSIGLAIVKHDAHTA